MIQEYGLCRPLKINNFGSVGLGELTWFLLVLWCGRGIRVFLYESGFLRNHVGDAANDGIGDTKLLIDQLIGFSIIPGEGQDKNIL